jgi:hypothetical protein
MKQYFSTFILSTILITLTSCEIPNTKEKAQTNLEPPIDIESSTTIEVTKDDEPPLLLDDEPLLLDEEPDEDSSSESMADNSRCFVCHINYEQEQIAVTHARQGMGCANCHGESDEHIADESWASGGNGTAPDKMFTRAQINPFCMGCHAKENIDTEQHKPLFTNDNEEKYCTDCHGDHRLTNRKCKWK